MADTTSASLSPTSPASDELPFPPELRHRKVRSLASEGAAGGVDTGEDTSDTDALPQAPVDLKQASDATTDALDNAIKDLPPRWRNWIVRGLSSFILIFGFGMIIYMGPLALVALIFVIQIKCYHELITIAYSVYRSYDLPWFRINSWYFLFSSNYYFYGESTIDYFGMLLRKSNYLDPFVRFHRIISFLLYCVGFVGFVLSLKKRHYLKQFIMFGWTHVTLLIVIAQSQLIVQNIFEGLIWFLLPVSIIIFNDIMAYVFGFFFGKTPLIKLSPKKTWEGFIGGFVSTLIFGILFSQVLLQYEHFLCPFTYNEEEQRLMTECERAPVFRQTTYQLPTFLTPVSWVVGNRDGTIDFYPFQIHALLFSVFGSLIGPFGGFFASGFKRAFKIKDFADTIPGHGGFMDRFDCQLIMGSFVHVYYSSFIRAADPRKLLLSILALKPDEQFLIFNVLKDQLRQRGLLPDPEVLPMQILEDVVGESASAGIETGPEVDTPEAPVGF